MRRVKGGDKTDRNSLFLSLDLNLHKLLLLFYLCLTCLTHLYSPPFTKIAFVESTHTEEQTLIFLIGGHHSCTGVHDFLIGLLSVYVHTFYSKFFLLWSVCWFGNTHQIKYITCYLQHTL